MEFEGRARIQTELNMAPMIDVVFLLLIFFMLTSTLIVEEGIELNLPTSANATPVNTTPLTVSIDKSGSIFLNKEELSLTDLTKQVGTLLLKQKNGEPHTIIVHSDAQVPVQVLINTMDAIKAGGGVNIALTTTKNTEDLK